MKIFNRLFLKVYLTVVGALILAIAVSAAVWRLGPDVEASRDVFDIAAKVTEAALADTSAPVEEQTKALTRLSRLLRTNMALYDSKGTIIASVGRALPKPGDEGDDKRFWHAHDHHWKINLQDGRILLLNPPIDPRRRGGTFFLHLIIVAIMLAIVSFPIVRGLTRRLERLQTGVETFGAGDLTARVPMEGKDEIARVAQSFNRAARRIEELVASHKMLLANASHELRTPLTRLRMGIELLKQSADQKLKSDLEQDIKELDELIDEILLASKLEADQSREAPEDIDLLALAAEEAARFEHVSVSGHSAVIKAAPRLIRRLLRNLLQNAERHGAPPIDIEIEDRPSSVCLKVTDRGPGISGEDLQRVFEPFFRRQPTAGSSSGSGLGLSLVQQIARHYGGEVSVQSARAGLCTFAVTFPRR